ncbi:MAG: ATP-binding cassette domain-containing protein [Lentilitoribacter sp.]
MINISNVSHQIGTSVILDDICLEIPSNGITAIIGPNGAGKSTLVNLIARQAALQSGQIAIDDLDLSSTATEALALKMALVSQSVGVASRIRVKELIAFGRWPHNKGVLRETDKNVINLALERFALVELQNRFLDQISGGQRQRAFIAMAFAQETDWMLLDEPLNNLDMFHARALMQELRSLTDHGNKGIVMVIHDVNYAARWSDNCIGLHSGKLIFSGPTNEVLTPKNIKDLFKVEVSRVSCGSQQLFDHY